MTIANTCVLVAAVLPVLTMGLAKFSTAGKKVREGGYDNRKPREWASKQEGWKARAAAAHSNGFEALPLFVFAVLAAQQAGLDQGRTDTLAIAFIVTRLVYIAIYLANQGALRSLVWGVGLAITIAIFAPTLSFAL
ncbi:MAG TPA: MAPEG family protein [Candidatus Aquabacterium excrementipullorum]|nr:MAPEG family protein [Candidatus Aquabacterium excrementipullorum]